MTNDINVVALAKDDEQYIFVYDDANRTEILKLLGRFAADSQLSFTWYDAALLSNRIREMANSTNNRIL